MTVAGMPDALGLVASTSVLGIPTMFVIMLVFGAGSQFLLSFTRLGRYMYAHRQQRGGGAPRRHQRDRRDAGGLQPGRGVRLSRAA